MRSPLAALILFFLPSVLATNADKLPDTIAKFCGSSVREPQANIGANGSVKVDIFRCSKEIDVRDAAGTSSTPEMEVVAGMHANELWNAPPKETNVCGATCDTHCFNPSGGGPDPNECNVIADALRYNSQNIGNLFDITTKDAVIRMQYKSCYSFFVNQAGTDLQYCRTDWASVLDYVAYNCQAQQNAHGGLCVARNQQWFIQAQHS